MSKCSINTGKPPGGAKLLSGDERGLTDLLQWPEDNLAAMVHWVLMVYKLFNHMDNLNPFTTIILTFSINL